MTSRILPIALATLVAGAGTPALAAPGTAKGYFRLHKTRSTFTSACPFRMPDPSGDAAGVTHVVLSDKPLDCDAADRTFDPVEAAKAQVRSQRPAFVTFTLPTAGKVERIEGGWESTAPEDGFSFGGQGTIAIAVNSDARVQGRYFMAAPSDFFDKTFQFDFSWDAAVLAGSTSGTPVPAGGGPIGAAYQKYLTAMGRGDLAALRSLVTAERGASLPDVKGSDAKKFMELIQLFELKTATVQGGAQRDDAAVLFVKGTGFDTSPNAGRVIMQREGGVWKVAKVIVKSPL